MNRSQWLDKATGPVASVIVGGATQNVWLAVAVAGVSVLLQVVSALLGLLDRWTFLRQGPKKRRDLIEYERVRREYRTGNH